MIEHIVTMATTSLYPCVVLPSCAKPAVASLLYRDLLSGMDTCCRVDADANLSTYKQTYIDNSIFHWQLRFDRHPQTHTEPIRTFSIGNRASTGMYWLSLALLTNAGNILWSLWATEELSSADISFSGLWPSQHGCAQGPRHGMSAPRQSVPLKIR